MYCKLFASLYQGTLRGKSDEILVFTNLLAHCGREGTVDKHFRAISEETGLPIERVKAAIEVLESADPESRSPEEDGARIVRMDEHRVWGWRIVNYGKYRAIRSEDDRAEQNRLAQQRWRDRNKSKPSSAKGKRDKPMEREREEGEELTAISTPRKLTGIPTSVEQAVSMAEMAGVPADYAETIFLEHEGSTWEDGQGRPINNFSSYIKARYTNRTNKLAREERRYSNRSNGTTPNGAPTANTVYQVQQQIDAINESITELDASVPGAWGELSPAKKVERRKLVERRTELKRKLSGLES